jgi:hypothetical protein
LHGLGDLLQIRIILDHHDFQEILAPGLGGRPG